MGHHRDVVHDRAMLSAQEFCCLERVASAAWQALRGKHYFGDNLDSLWRHIHKERVDLIYLGSRFNGEGLQVAVQALQREYAR
jgi:hypothetical protein